MRLDARLSRAMLVVLGVAVVAASLASPAAADRRYKGQGGNRGYGGPRVVQHVYSSPGRGYAYSRGSRGGPDLAVFIGGLIVGNALAHAAQSRQVYCPPVEADNNYYYDPYYHERFSSLDACRHTTVVLVINGNTGRCVGERYWQGGRWRDRGDSRGYGDRDYDDRGYNDRGYGGDGDGQYGDQGGQGGDRNR